MNLNTVFKTYAAQMQETGGDPEPGSLEINGGEINLYFSNAETEPAPEAMTLDPLGPYTGIVEIIPAARWIGAVAASGSPVVTQFRVAVE
jgi:hypothetical protein